MGLLPFPGAMNAQPAKLMEGVRLWRIAVNHCRYLLENPATKAASDE